ncbi:MAG: LPS export ABC transporter periplasmic protein LptC [Desulfobulbus sp.]|nr:MAG: LPS export ABC transporter periplasmic protein LptC [Desulfobulbus sp.]
MMKNPRNLLWMIPLGFMLSSPLWKGYVADFLKPRGGYDAKVAEAYKRQTQNFIMDNIGITLSTNGQVEWRIKAKRAFTGKSDREIGMIDVDARYTSKGKAPMAITSDRGTYLMDDRHLILIDSVVVEKPAAHEQLFTDLLHYYDATKMVVCPVDVEIKGPQFDVHAGRLDYDLSSDAYDFNDRVIVEM